MWLLEFIQINENLWASGLSQIATAFNLTNTNIVLLILVFLDTNLNASLQSVINSLSLVGAVVGQLFFAIMGTCLVVVRVLLRVPSSKFVAVHWPL